MDASTPSLLRRGHLTCHCLVVEVGSQLVLVDTGFGLRDVADPASRLSRLFLLLLGPDFRVEMTAVRQIERLGLDPRDVRHIVLTHLDFDHAGGLDDFPHAEVHLLARERDAALAQASALDRMRYRPQQWGTRERWRVYQSGEGDSWYGFDRVHALDGLPPDIALVPLIGHTLGHCGVAVRRDTDWLLLAGDAYFFHDELDPIEPWCPPGLRLYQRLMDKDRTARLWNQQRLRTLRREHPDAVTLTCSHDVHEFERLSGRSARIPAHSLTGRWPATPPSLV